MIDQTEKENPSNAIWLLALCLAAAAFYFAQFFLYFREATFYGMGLNYINNLEAIKGADYLKQFVLHTRFYPPFYYLFIFLVHTLAGFHYLAFIAAGSLFPFIGACYLYLAAKRISGSQAGALAFCLALLFPATTVYTKTLIIEAPLLLFVPAFFYHGLASERFTNVPHAIAAGLFFALGMLTKWSLLAYAFGFGLWLILDLFVDLSSLKRREVQPQQIRGLLIALGTLALVAGPWYLLSFDPGLFRQSAGNDPTFVPYSLEKNFGFNFRVLRQSAGVAAPYVIGLLAVIALLRKSTRLKTIGWFAVLVALPVCIFCLPGHMEDRYMWPVFPGLALFGGFCFKALGQASGSVWRKILLTVLVVLLAVASHRQFVQKRGEPTIMLAHNFAGGTLFWKRADAGVVLGAVYECTTAAIEEEQEVTLAVHPFMVNPHILESHLRYHQNADPRFSVFRIPGIDLYEYPDLIQMTQNGEVDFLLLDADRWRNYNDPGFDPNKDMLRHVIARGYVDQSGGQAHEPLSLESFLGDLDYLRKQFRVVRVLHLDKADVWVLVSNNFEKRHGRVKQDEDAKAITDF